ncbi:hypothetical protein HZA87_00940 [Candidatus Uhrbacteria bacterium]|nr:hypothetical protein [Candidatus Uhrbacteria bacterium]
MIRLIFLIVAFILLSTGELGFISALPFPMDRTPLLLVVSVFLFQSFDVGPSAWWVVFHGLMLDLMGTSFVRLETLSYSAAAVVLVLCSRHLFSNRSFWGILGTFTLSLLALTCMEVILSVFQVIFQNGSLSFQALLSLRLWGLGMGAILLLLFFPLSEFFVRLHTRFLSS